MLPLDVELVRVCTGYSYVLTLTAPGTFVKSQCEPEPEQNWKATHFNSLVENKWTKLQVWKHHQSLNHQSSQVNQHQVWLEYYESHIGIITLCYTICRTSCCHSPGPDPAHSTMILEGPDVKTVERLLSVKQLHLNVLNQCTRNLISLSFCLLAFTKQKET